MATDMNETRRVLETVFAERLRQETKWGPQTHTRLEWLAILTEEVGEVAKLCCDEWIEGRQSLGLILGELHQVAAVAVAAIEDLTALAIKEATKP